MKRKLTMALAAVLVVASVGVVNAAAPESPQYTGCVLPRSGILQSVAVGEEPLFPCPTSATEISWGAVGPAGPAGPPGVAVLVVEDEVQVTGYTLDFSVVRSVSEIGPDRTVEQELAYMRGVLWEWAGEAFGPPNIGPVHFPEDLILDTVEVVGDQLIARVVLFRSFDE